MGSAPARLRRAEGGTAWVVGWGEGRIGRRREQRHGEPWRSSGGPRGAAACRRSLLSARRIWWGRRDGDDEGARRRGRRGSGDEGVRVAGERVGEGERVRRWRGRRGRRPAGHGEEGG
jgi:hypothetical protein